MPSPQPIKYHTSVAKYLELKAKYQQTYTRENGIGYFLDNGEWVEENEFKKRYPLPLTLFSHKRGGNADGTKAFLGY